MKLKEYLVLFALVYGALLLHESVGLNAIGGLTLILTGIFLTGRKTSREQQIHR